MNRRSPFYSLWDPIRALSALGRELPESSNELWNRFFDGDGPRGWAWNPRFELIERPEAFLFRVELPGLKAGDIEVTLSDDVLTVKGEKKQEESREGEHYRISERTYGSFERSVTIPGPIRADSLDATMKDGVLEVKLARQAGGRPAKIQVKSL